MLDINLLVNEFVVYAKKNLLSNNSYEDELFSRNIILGELNIDSFKEVELDSSRVKETENMKNPDYFVDSLTSYLKETTELTDNEIDRKITKILGLLTPFPSEVVRKFNDIYHKVSDEEALKYLYSLSIYNDYVKKSKIDKNLVWESDFEDKNIEVSINLSKPEKNNKDIAKLLVKKDPSLEKYPKCLLCKENLGYYGRDDHPARENIRLIPLNLEGERWYLQYSPYGYFNMHCIVLRDCHSNMVINESTFKKLASFVDTFPYFFVGSNADLPIVGGSILNHEHYQGGEHILPIMHSKVKEYIDIDESKHSSKVGILDWYNSTVLIEGRDKNDVTFLATKILDHWRNYDDLDNEILSHEGETRHNTITPCIRKIGETYYLYLILRNNRCNETYPDGIFHAHPEYHHIKHEGIGIIEAMGLFILPARLIRQSNQMKDCLKNNLNDDEIVAKYPDMTGNFLTMIHELKENYNEETIDSDIRKYINNVCMNILKNTAVFKEDEKGQAGFKKFLKGVNF